MANDRKVFSATSVDPGSGRLEEAAELRTKFFVLYSGLAEWHRDAWTKATLLIRRNRQALDKARAIAEKAANGSNNAMLIDRF